MAVEASVAVQQIPMPRSLDGLAAQWREDAETLRRRGATAQAVLLESCADELATVLRERDLEALTIQQASEESGYSYSALQKMVAKGELANVGDKHRPRVRRGDIPHKIQKRRLQALDGEPDLAGTILTGG